MLSVSGQPYYLSREHVRRDEEWDRLKALVRDYVPQEVPA